MDMAPRPEKKKEANVEEPILALSCDKKNPQKTNKKKSSGSIEVFGKTAIKLDTLYYCTECILLLPFEVCYWCSLTSAGKSGMFTY